MDEKKNKSKKKAAKQKQPPRYKALMYTQQINHLKLGNVDNLIDRIEKSFNYTDYAVILHDKDTKKDSTDLAEEHVHVMFHFKNARTVQSVAKKLNDDDQYVKIWKDGTCNNGFAYLIHGTAKAKAQGKHQYDISEVRANFDYSALMYKMNVEIAKAKAKSSIDINVFLDLLYKGEITKAELESRLTGSEYARYRRQIDDVWAKYLQNRAEAFRKEMREKGEPIKVIWIYGPAGTGKTSLARVQAAKAGTDYFISGSSRDIFQEYAGQHTIILDELRPASIVYSDLLRMTDPYGAGDEVMAPSRFRDKAIASNLIIITSPYDPYMFHRASTGDKVDGLDQLVRRLSLVIEMSAQTMCLAKFDERCGAFKPVDGTERKNDYSSQARPQPAVDSTELYNAMFD